jgi:hypothetical protein
VDFNVSIPALSGLLSAQLIQAAVQMSLIRESPSFLGKPGLTVFYLLLCVRVPSDLEADERIYLVQAT